MSSTIPTRIQEVELDEIETGDCPECAGQLEHDRHETYCGDCGLVVHQVPIDRHSESRGYDTDGDTRERQLAVDTLHDSGMTTSIGHYSEVDRLNVSSRRRRELVRVLGAHARSRAGSKHERNRRQGFSEIQRMVGVMELPYHVHRCACQIFREFHDDGHLRGRVIEGVATAAVYAASRIHHYPITMTALTDVARVEQSRVWHCLKVAKQDLGLSVPPLLAAELVPRIASEVEYDLDSEQRQEAVELARLVDDEPGIGNGPRGIAAAAVYLGADGRMNGEITQQDAAEAVGCRPKTMQSAMATIENLVERKSRGAGGSDIALVADGGQS